MPVCLAVFAACSSSASPDPISTARPTIITPSPTETASVTVSPTPVSMGTSTPTFTPEPTPYPPLIWANDLSPIVLGTYATEWSPTSNELLLDNCFDSTISKKEIFRAGPPDFVPTAINSQDVACQLVYQVATWTPDGTHVVFSGNMPDGSSIDVSRVWMMDKDGNNPYPISSCGRYINFFAWMDSDTLVYLSYAGGGHQVLHVLDVFSETQIMETGMHGGFHHTAGPYISGTYLAPRAIPVVVSMTPDYENVPGIIFLNPEYVRLPPYIGSEDDHFFNDAQSEGWRGERPQLLLRRIYHSFGDDPYSRITRLVLWDVESESITVVAEGVVDAQFSPDGNILAYLTLGPPWLDEDNKPLTGYYKPLALHESQYLNLLDMVTGRVIYSVPVADYQFVFGSGERPEDIDYQLRIAFSPDNHYLTYFSLNHDSQTVLNVLDLSTLDLVYSGLADMFLPVWSPTGSRLIYRDHHVNLALLEMNTLTLKPLTLSGAQRVSLIDWSFDGQYVDLSLSDRPSERPYTVILELPE